MTAAGLTAAIATVVEHGHGERVIAAFHYSDETEVRALTGFVAAPDYRVIPANNAAYTRDVTNPGSMYNRFIGIFGAAEVWIKPWSIADYCFVWDAGSPMKPLVLREDKVAGYQGLRLAATLDTYPLYAQYFEASFGYGVWTRTNGCAWYFASASIS